MKKFIGFTNFVILLNPFMFSKKASIIDEIFTVDLTFCSKCQIKIHFFFWGMLYWGSPKFYWGVTIFDRDQGQKTSLTKLVLKRSVLKQSLPNSQHKLLQTSQNEAYVEAAQNFIEAWHFSLQIGHKKHPSINWF